MTKKKSEKESLNIEDLIIKEYGDIITNADYVRNLRSKIIPTTPKLDIALGGGIPEGTFTIITGQPKIGKSSLSLQIAAEAQKIDSDYGPRVVVYIDAEGRIKERDLFGNKKLNLDPTRFKLVQSKPGNILTGDKFIGIAEKFINAMPGCVLIFDSFSALCSQGRLESNVGDRFRDDMPLILAAFCKRISQVVAINKSVLIGITHRIANQSGMGHSQWTEASGQKLQYAADNKLGATYFKILQDTEGSTIGQEVFWKISTSSLGSPGQETNSFLRFGYGYDEYLEYIDIGIDAGLVSKSASWLAYEGHKAQGHEKLRAVLLENPELFKKLKEQVDSIFKTKSA